MIVNIGKMGTVTTTTRHYIDEPKTLQGRFSCPIDEEGRWYRDESKTTGFNQDFYVNTNHIVSIEPAVKENIKCTRIVLSTGEEFATLNNVSECLKLIQS